MLDARGERLRRMLGYITSDGQGRADALLAEAAQRLLDRGWPLAGTLQMNVERAGGGPCHMDLHVLASHAVIRISQNLGPLSRGCRLDPGALEEAAGLVERALDAGGADRPRLLIVNKFGKQEADGRGFRPLIGRALAQGLPVLTAVGRGNLDAFAAFAGELAEPLPAEVPAILAWADRSAAAAA